MNPELDKTARPGLKTYVANTRRSLASLVT